MGAKKQAGKDPGGSEQEQREGAQTSPAPERCAPVWNAAQPPRPGEEVATTSSSSFTPPPSPSLSLRCKTLSASQRASHAGCKVDVSSSLCLCLSAAGTLLKSRDA